MITQVLHLVQEALFREKAAGALHQGKSESQALAEQRFGLVASALGQRIL